MLQRRTLIIGKAKSGILALILVISALLVFQTGTAEAHCDAIDGPVVTAAREALETEDVTLVLPYVQPEYEEATIAAFQHTLEVRKLGPEARELADQYFFETAVRLHRAGEGAPYTGLKPGGDHGPALEAADQALESNSLSAVNNLLLKEVREGIAEKYAAVEEARAHAAAENTVAAQRERVEAELVFEKYVFELYNLATEQTALPVEGGEAHSH